MPENVHVEITVQDAKDSAKREPASPPPPHANDSTKSIDITKTGSTRKIVVTTRQGKVSVYWVFDGFIFTMGQDGKRVDRDVFDGTMHPAFLRAGGRDYYGVEGVAMEQYKGISPFKGKPCYFYKQEAPATPERQPKALEFQALDGAPPMPSAFTGANQIWIDAVTKLPVAAVLPEGLCTYNFLPAPQAPLDPPPQFVKYSEYMKAMSTRMQKEAATR